MPVTEVANLLIGLVATLVLGLAVKHVMRFAMKASDLPAPNQTLARQWKEMVVSGGESGRVLGHLERLLFFAAFWSDAQIVVAGWLAFKVASKWNAWTNVVAVPKEIDGLDPIDFLIARRKWGSHVLMTFLIGTLCNILVGFVGAAIGRHSIGIVRQVL
jgi:hypothetical protein